MNKSKISTKELTLCAMFTALIAIGAFIRIPVPVVPFTLQFLFTMLGGLLLGGRLGSLSVLSYIVLGLFGMPIFAEGGGLGYVFNPSFGYIIGFCIASYITGVIGNNVKNPSIKRLLIANFLGLFIVYVIGMTYYWVIVTFYVGTGIGIWTLFLYCFILAVPGDILLCILSAVLAKRLIPLINKITEA